MTEHFSKTIHYFIHKVGFQTIKHPTKTEAHTVNNTRHPSFHHHLLNAKKHLKISLQYHSPIFKQSVNIHYSLLQHLKKKRLICNIIDNTSFAGIFRYDGKSYTHLTSKKNSHR